MLRSLVGHRDDTGRTRSPGHDDFDVTASWVADEDIVSLLVWALDIPIRKDGLHFLVADFSHGLSVSSVLRVRRLAWMAHLGRPL